MADILIWTKHPGDVLGEAIDFLTHGTAEHAGFRRKNGMIHEAYFPRVRDRAPVKDELPFVCAFKIKGITPELEDAFELSFDKAIKANTEYSVEDLFRFLFNVPSADEKHTFCSRYVMHTIMQLCPSDMWPQTRCMNGDWVSPRDLYISNLLIPTTPLVLLPTVQS